MTPPPLTISQQKRRSNTPGQTLWPHLELHDRPCNMAASRNFCGDFFEEATAVVFGGMRLVTDSQCDVCPDIKLVGLNHYGEVKCIGNNGSAIIYEHRRTKDLEFISRNGVTLEYFFWRHQTSVNDYRYVGVLRESLARTVSDLVRIPATVVHAYLADKPTRVLNTKTKTDSGQRLGYGTNGYGKGWSIPYTVLQEMAMTGRYSNFQQAQTIHLRVYGLRLKEFDYREYRN